MRHPKEGTPFVPPSHICPTHQSGELPDLSITAFEFNIDVLGGRTYYCAVFGRVASDEYTGIYDADFVGTAMPAVPSDSELARQLHTIAGLSGIEDVESASATITSNEHPVVEHMRTAFCERVADCQGLINGECWALGASAVREVVEEALRTKEL